MISKLCKVALCFFSAGVLVTAHADEPLKVDTRGVTAKILYEAPIDGGHLPELKGKYKMRITEITIAPGGHVGDHNHLGPGIRQMTVGEMEYILPDKTMIYRAGDFFFETGDVSHRVNNKTSEPNTHLLFEILPLDLKGASLIISRDKPPSVGFWGRDPTVKAQTQRDDSRCPVLGHALPWAPQYKARRQRTLSARAELKNEDRIRNSPSLVSS